MSDRIKDLIKQGLSRAGFRVSRVDAYVQAELEDRQQFEQAAKGIIAAHDAQTVEHIEALRCRYQSPLVGKTSVWEQIERLSLCIDPTDHHLLCTNQYIHVGQVVDAMERAGVEDDDLRLAALVHDLGKVLLLHGEAPENVVCLNHPVSQGAPACGLDACVFQWNHDEFAWTRLRHHVPPQVAWLIRYHSIDIEECRPYMNEQDLVYMERYLRPFQHFDQGSKSVGRLVTPERHRHVVERYFPHPILF